MGGVETCLCWQTRGALGGSFHCRQCVYNYAYFGEAQLVGSLTLRRNAVEKLSGHSDLCINLLCKVIQHMRVLLRACAACVRAHFMPGACARYSNPVYTKRIVELKHGRYTAKDVPHLVACLPCLQPFTEDCVYRRFNFALTWNLSLASTPVFAKGLHFGAFH